MHTPRLATAADVPQLAALYADTARRLGGWCYSPQQVQAWASFAADLDAFADYVLSASTWVYTSEVSGMGAGNAGVAGDAGDAVGETREVKAAQQSGRILGFCGVAHSGEVHSLYVRADHCRQGLGGRMLAHALATARGQGIQHFAAWVTPFSRPVFERAGFVLVRTSTEPFKGVLFERYRVELG